MTFIQEDLEVYQDKKKELEGVINPIMTKLYQSGGGGEPGTMPTGSMPTGNVPPDVALP